MKNIRQLCATVALTLIFAFHTYAGQMETLIVTPPPPPSVTTDGQIGTGFADHSTNDSSEAVNPIMQFTLNVLQSVLSLL
jgi:hypothetical protein